MFLKDISKLSQNRSIHFKLGLILSLTLSIFAINWTTSPTTIEYEQMEELKPLIEVEVVPNTRREKPVPPPPVVKVSDIIEIETQPEFTEKPELEPIDKNIETVERETFISNVSAPKSPTIPTPPPLPDLPKEEDILFKVVEEMPRFAGCEDDALNKAEKKKCAETKLLKFLVKKLKYPPIARDNGIEGTVVIRFIVEKDGQISHAKIIREIGGGCGKEALRVVGEMPNWLPGKQRGRPVRVQFNLPVKFHLQ